MTTKTQIEKILGNGRVKTNFNLSPYLTLRTQTEAEFYFEAESREDIINSIIAAADSKIPYFLIGGGSNLAITKKKLPGLIVRNKYLSRKIEEKNGEIFLTVSSGYPITKLAKDLAENGFAGLEYHFGLPGTIGGALYMNSKWTNPVNYVGDNLISAILADKNGTEKKVDKNYFNFAYDQSILQKSNEIVLDAVFKLYKTDSAITKKHAKLATEYRNLTQPHGVFTSGCFFRNVNGESAGKIVDQAGLKGTRVGKFHVSDLHANFIINDGNGDPGDLKKLIKNIKEKVKEKFGIYLVEEVIVI